MTAVQSSVRIGLLSDTHLDSRRIPPWRWWDRWITAGTARAELLAILRHRMRGVDEIWHAGDVGDPRLLDEIEEEVGASVQVVRGHADGGRWGRRLPPILRREIAGARCAVVHGGGTPRYILDRIMYGIGWSWDVVVFGHTHRPLVRRRDGVLFVNPGSPSDHRFTPYRSIALLEIQDGRCDAQLIDLEPDLTGRGSPLE